MVPMAVMSIVLAPVGRPPHRPGAPALVTGIGFVLRIVGLFGLSPEMTPDSATWQILLPMALLGVGNAFIWAPTPRPPTATCR